MSIWNITDHIDEINDSVTLETSKVERNAPNKFRFACNIEWKQQLAVKNTPARPNVLFGG